MYKGRLKNGFQTALRCYCLFAFFIGFQQDGVQLVFQM